MIPDSPTVLGEVLTALGLGVGFCDERGANRLTQPNSTASEAAPSKRGEAQDPGGWRFRSKSSWLRRIQRPNPAGTAWRIGATAVCERKEPSLVRTEEGFVRTVWPTVKVNDN